MSLGRSDIPKDPASSRTQLYAEGLLTRCTMRSSTTSSPRYRGWRKAGPRIAAVMCLPQRAQRWLRFEGTAAAAIAEPRRLQGRVPAASASNVAPAAEVLRAATGLRCSPIIRSTVDEPPDNAQPKSKDPNWRL